MRQSNDNGESNENSWFITTVINNDNVTVLKHLRFVAPIVTKDRGPSVICFVHFANFSQVPIILN